MGDETAQAAGARREMVEDLYGRYGALVYRTCRAILADHHAAEDATQEVFAKLVGQADLGEVRDRRRWLLEVARNHCIDRRRQAARRPTAPIAASQAARDDAEASSLAREHLRWLLSLLTPRQRDVVVHQAVLDEPLDTVASRLGMSYGAAAQLLYRARLVLAKSGGAGDAALVAVGGPIAGLGRRLHSLVQRAALGGRLHADRMPFDAALALPAAALLVSLLARQPAAPHPQLPAPRLPAVSVAAATSGVVRTASVSSRSGTVVVTVHHPVAPAPAASPPAAVPAPPGVKKKPLVLNNQACIKAAGMEECFSTSSADTRFSVGGLPPLP